MKWFKYLAIFGVLVAALFVFNPMQAFAARSGGRMGGGGFGRSMGMGSGSGSMFGGSSRSALGTGSGFGSKWGSGWGSGHRSSTSVHVGFSPFMPMPLGFGGDTIITLVAAAGIAYFLSGMFTDTSRRMGAGGYDDEEDDGPTVVAKVQLGLLSNARAIQSKLNRLGDRIDTDTSEGLSQLLQETVLEINRNPEYVEYAFVDTKDSRSIDKAEQMFNEQSMQERSKFKEETLSNVGGRKSSSKMSSSSGGNNDLIVITIVLAAQGNVRIPQIRTKEDLKLVLNRLASLPKDNLVALEVLWTPQDSSDSFSKDDLIMDYPYMISI